jgi:uncharacterized protein (TIGR02147 family)
MALLAIWKFDAYQDFMKAYMKSLPHNGRGYSTKMAEALSIHPTLLSQIMQGHRDLTLEQAALFCDHVRLSEKEGDLFLKLVEFSRAGNESLRKRLLRQLDTIKSEYKEVRAHVATSAKELTDEEKSIFYSSWQYSAFRMMCSLKVAVSAEEIATHLQITRERAQTIETFLLKTGLIMEQKGRLVLGPFNTHVGAESYWSTRHHLNWRTKNLNKVEHLSKEELCFTAPFSCSAQDFKKIKESVLALIRETSSTVSKTTPEHVYTLCVDLMKV